jgi:hypothetical protein
MLKTDKEFREYLDVETERHHDVVDGKVVNKTGTPMVDIVRAGAEAARELASASPVYEAQAIRDECDIDVAERADALKPGQTLFGLSMTPVKELETYKEAYEKLGYKKELVYIQAYTKIDDHNLVARSFSVDGGSERQWREHLAAAGITIPPGVSTNTWLKYATVVDADESQSRQLIHKLRGTYYERIGSTHTRYSVSEYVARHHGTIKKFFDLYYPALAQAAYNGHNNDTLRGLASQMLATDLTRLKSDIRQHIMLMANARTLNQDTVQAADSLIRYAIVEELRKGVAGLVMHQATDPRVSANLPARTMLLQAGNANQIHMLMAGNMQQGMLAGRSYAGCSYNVELLDQQHILSSPDSPSRQEPYGGREGGEGVGRIGIGQCIVPNCPTSPRKVLVGGCGVCLGRCQKLFDIGKDPTKMSAPFSFMKTAVAKQAAVISLNEKRQEKQDEHAESAALEPEKAPEMVAAA